MSNQDILDALAKISTRLSNLEIAVGGKTSGGGDDEDEKAPQVEAFEAFNGDKVKAFADALDGLPTTLPITGTNIKLNMRAIARTTKTVTGSIFIN